MEAAVQPKTTINETGVLPKGPLVVGRNWGLRAMSLAVHEHPLQYYVLYIYVSPEKLTHTMLLPTLGYRVETILRRYLLQLHSYTKELPPINYGDMNATSCASSCSHYFRKPARRPAQDP